MNRFVTLSSCTVPRFECYKLSLPFGGGTNDTVTLRLFQHCEMKFGSWTYDGNEVDLVHHDSHNALQSTENGFNITVVLDGIDISDVNNNLKNNGISFRYKL